MSWIEMNNGELPSNRSAQVLHVGSEMELQPYRPLPWAALSAEERSDCLALLGEVLTSASDHGFASPLSFRVISSSGERFTIRIADTPDAGLSPGNCAVPAPAELVDSLDGRRLKLEITRRLKAVEYDRVDLIVSFVMKSGLNLIRADLETAMQRGAQVRLLTTDYLSITDADALAQLLDLVEGSTLPQSDGSLAVKVFSDATTSFHPKAYLFWASEGDIASGIVGSSNLSYSGIQSGIEWSLISGDVSQMLTSFQRHWDDLRSVDLSHEFLRSYRSRWTRLLKEPEPVAIEREPVSESPEPRPIQNEALTSLEQTRDDGHQSGLVVMATGLGKTWLAAFDSAAFGAQRTLFVAHREEILKHSLNVFRQVSPSLELGIFNGQHKQPHADIVFASVQTLHNQLGQFDPSEFDYVVVDEFHHASAPTYRKVIDYFEPSFLLGLTATPQRMDGADLFALCGDNLAFECNLIEGIDRSELVPFNYFGIKDVVDYEPIPWRNGKFSTEALVSAFETEQRAQQAFDEWDAKCGHRTLAFCVTVSHVDYMADFFTMRGVRCAAVHTGPNSADRVEAIADLAAGDLQVLFSVDMFNEGLDVPTIDSVLMLRPTESPTIFLQQLGRGLRISAGKESLSVVDFVGNHRSFLLKPRALLGISAEREPSTQEVKEALATQVWDLPTGCSIVFDVEAIDLLNGLIEKSISQSRGDVLREFVIDWTNEHGMRPTAAQAFASGYNPSTAKPNWFEFLADTGTLTEGEKPVVLENSVLLNRFQREPITKSHKLVLLRALLAEGSLRSGLPVDRACERSLRLVQADPLLSRDCVTQMVPDPSTVSAEQWRAYWLKNPVRYLTEREDALYRLESDQIVPTFEVSNDGDHFDALVAELIEWRMAEYHLNATVKADTRMVCKVSHSGGKPILFLDRKKYPGLPTGSTAVTVKGTTYSAEFVKIAVNVIRNDAGENVIAPLLRDLFGSDAGLPGTRHQVALGVNTGEEWRLEPVQSVGLQQFIGQRFKRDKVPTLFGVEFNSGNWQSGHISLDQDVVLFVTLQKAGHESSYEDYFAEDGTFVWSSQNSTGPDGKKGREIIQAAETGTKLHLFAREKKADVAFTYCGTLSYVRHEGSKPMSVTFRLDEPATGGLFDPRKGADQADTD